MPFTFSHPAAVLPLARRNLSISGLVIGSMIPDLVYFLRLMPLRDFTHSIPGLLLYCLPVGMAVLWLYHAWLKAPLAALFPEFQGLISGSGEEFRFLPARRLAVLSLSILIGAITHIFWDGFTHEDGWALHYFPFLGDTALDLGFDRISLTRVLHHAGSVLGGAYIVLWTRKHLSRAKTPAGAPNGGNLVVLNSLWVRIPLALSAALGYLFAWSQAGLVGTYHELRLVMVQGLFASGTFLLCFLLFYSAYWHFKSNN
jgi:hypothetical protein